MKMWAYGQTDIGMRRANNEDCFLVDDSLGLYVVCDGMGGHNAGEVAAQEASQALREYLGQHRPTLDMLSEAADWAGVQELVVRAVRHASRVVREHGKLSGHEGMGTTVTLLLAVGDRAVIASVGDSRAYHCRDKSTNLVTQDHTLANEMLIAGEISPAQARESPFRHFLTRTVGTQENVEVDTLVAHLVAGDIFLLCSDGLSCYFDSDEDLGQYMFKRPSQIPQELVAYANSRGGVDNVTALVIHVEDEAAAESQSITRSLQKWFTRVAVL
jgi:protein phosphatase